ncbi:hypothetical protein C922_05044 [Plasmodium inui San Antonio 1]|uniref:Uncharacterized protein n=1 Tax=Plasmodium inui San Antonio 1 TaxID=1237626 RepID=W6ZZ56_9APIC|nr:hypothetical protein C922_05044 [Plasmodium inui San Antonio 1]EUD64573.1 hypothetical protein C922_05044 [Plasmodium inui San Antonio 1]
MDVNYHNESTCTVVARIQAQFGYLISQDSGKERKNKSSLPQMVKITLFVVLIWASRLSIEDDLPKTAPCEKIRKCSVKPLLHAVEHEE